MVMGSSLSLLQCIMMKNENFMKKQKKDQIIQINVKKYDYIYFYCDFCNYMVMDVYDIWQFRI